jgi:hypothetical protein
MIFFSILRYKIIMAEVGCLKDGHFQNLEVGNTTILENLEVVNTSILENLGESITITSVVSDRPLLILEHTGTTLGESAEIRLEKDSTGGGIQPNEQLGKISFHGQDGVGNQGPVAALEVTMPNIGDGTENGKLSLQVSSGGGAPVEALGISGSEVGGEQQGSNTIVSIPGIFSGQGIRMTAVGSATYTGSGWGGLGVYKGLIITATWPANAYLLTVDTFITVNAVTSVDPADDTIINIADGTRAIVGLATAVNSDGTTAPGAEGVVIAAANANRMVGQTASVAIVDASDAVRLNTSDRTFTATIYHDTNGTNDGGGDLATAIVPGSCKVYIVYTGFFTA